VNKSIFATVSAVFLLISIFLVCSCAGQNASYQLSNSSLNSSSSITPAVNSETEDALSKISLVDVTNFTILTDIGNIKVKQGDKYEITGENLVHDWISIETQDSKLILRYQPPTPEDIKNIDTSTHLFTITIPSEHFLKEAVFNAGTGNLSIENFSTENLTVSQGCGSMNIYNTSVNNLIAECGTGMLDGKNIIVKQNTQLHTGTGEVTFSGDLSGMISLEGGTGNATLDLSQPKENYIIKGESVRQILLDGKPMKNYSDEWENFEAFENTQLNKQY
jgi:hypothetical protein